MQYNIKNSIKMTALYARFSRNDSDNESDSIDNQRKILQNYAKEKGFHLTRFYADDGVTGTTFERPEFQKMLTDIENGEIDTIIVKDLSRFGRLSGMVGYYIDFWFPQKSIRFIAISDDVDTDKGENELAPLKNFFNEWYPRDTSKKVRTVLRNKGMNGGILCTKPIYGYKIDPENKNHWLIDEEAATVVKRIYDLYTEQNLGTSQISNLFNKDNVPTPLEYFIQKGLCTDPRKNDRKISIWDLSTLRNILRNQAYCGDVVNFKTYRKSYKDHKMYRNAPEDYCIFKGVNDPIISEEQYNKAQKILDMQRRVPTVRDPDLFQGYLYCADCGKRLTVRRAKNFNTYICNAYTRSRLLCTAHYIRQDVLSDFVLQQIRKLIHEQKNSPDVFIHRLQKDLDVKSEKEIKKAKKDIQKLQIRISELNKIILKLYEDRALEKISEDRYFSMVINYEIEQKEINSKIENYQEKLCAERKTSDSIHRFIATISKYSNDNITELNQHVLLDLVDKIVIGQKQDGQDFKDIIKIYFKEIGNIFFD